MTEWPVVVSSDRFPRHLLQFNTLLSVMLSIAVLTNEVCDCCSDAFFVFASNGSRVWLCLVKSVSFISLGG